MNLQQLYYFQKIAECQQYTLAARELHVTQATLSYAITNLEQELGARLFERKGKTVSLTPCGTAYLDCVGEALLALERGRQAVRDTALAAKAMVRISYLESVKHLILRLMADMCAGGEDPDLRFELLPSNASVIEQQLLRREADLGVSTLPAAEGIASRLIGYQDNVVVVPKQNPWACLDAVSLADLDHQRFIAYNRECRIRAYYDGILDAAGVRPEIFAESRFHSNILDMVSLGMGIALVPRMKRLKERYDLVALPIRDSIAPRAIYLLWIADTELPPEVEAFRRSLLESGDLARYL
ncbi:LysR family transcriptional regulator [uncultured Dysosmobacter sp.]|uniref:LysR family transcriptional regulator n=1 Tax=uncultured Dysosmobacter sp. TaxID=2591384 RepID=UPI00261D7B4C|nr:LysR family transcriptional regulator [uncultured Dysosmobacter sp.]